MGGTWQATGNFLSLAYVVAIYAVPSIFLYGIFISSLLEISARKLSVDSTVEWVVSGLFHVILGFFFGFILQSFLFSIVGGTAALLFFGFDRIIITFLPLLKQRVRVVLMIAPLLLFGIAVSSIYISSTPKPPFTVMDAVEFATSGNGTLIDLFPKQEGVIKLKIEGYEVERETKVIDTTNEQYLIYFIERWRKREESGEHRMIYKVTRGTMDAKGGDGTDPPYQR
ncbi:hypothetical protein [Paenibacillus guangzhouensis]|uniref:hypothetical protein n=1 Tax=Paenibacillus guangzhouensis TaxID=1473112 RepID=UPI0012669738|nr:hypothetical protein [Paenibacillus guangzhouensis]